MDAGLLSAQAAGTEASVYTSFAGLNQLKALAGKDSSAAVKQVARQFEAVFMQMMLKSMRAADFGDGLMDGPQSDMYRGLFDQQLALTLSTQGNGLGVAAMIEKQLARGSDAKPAAATHGATGTAAKPAALPMPVEAATSGAQPNAATGTQQPGALQAGLSFAGSLLQSALPTSPQAFVQAMAPYAEQAARQLGVSARALLAQAALETGWGAHMPRLADGAPSNNLFGIKAGGAWQGASVSVPTLEYESGVAVRRVDAFRAYASPAQSFMDYARLIASSPRYAAALGQGENIAGFAQALQQGGYATDPAYASKLVQVADSAPMRAALAALKNAAGAPLASW